MGGDVPQGQWRTGEVARCRAAGPVGPTPPVDAKPDVGPTRVSARLMAPDDPVHDADPGALLQRAPLWPSEP